MVYPITAHAMDAPARRGRRLRGRGDDDPGSDWLRDDARGRERPALGRAAGRGRRGFRHWIGVLAMANDENNGSVALDENGARVVRAAFNPREQERIDARARVLARRCWRRPARRACAGRGSITTHVQGTCRMGSDPGALGRRRRCAVLGRQAALRRRCVGDPAHALGQSVAHHHGAREPPRRAPPRRSHGYLT